jgi:hypothetical protein
MLSKLGLQDRRELATWQPGRTKVAGRWWGGAALTKLAGWLSAHRAAAGMAVLGVAGVAALAGVLLSLGGGPPANGEGTPVPTTTAVAVPPSPQPSAGPERERALLAYTKNPCLGCLIPLAEVWLLDAEDGVPRQLELPPGWEGAVLHGWDDAGPALIVSTLQDGIPDLWRLDIAATAQGWQVVKLFRLTKSEYREEYALVAAATGYVALVGVECESAPLVCPPLHVIGRDGQPVTPTTFNPTAVPLTWTPDGHRLVYVTDDQLEGQPADRLNVASADATGEQVLLITTGQIAAHAASTPDGRLVAILESPTRTGPSETSVLSPAPSPRPFSGATIASSGRSWRRTASFRFTPRQPARPAFGRCSRSSAARASRTSPGR